MIFQKKIFLIFFGISLLIGVIFLINKTSNKKDDIFYNLNETNITRVIDFNQASVYLGGNLINLNIADTEELRYLGLSFVDEIQENTGMLFVFEDSARYGFWMKDMRQSLDILWINNDFEIIYIKESVKPETYPEIFYSDTPAKYVLELKDGFVRKNSIKIGDKLINFQR